MLCAVIYVEVWYVKKQFKYHTLVENGETEIQTQNFVLPRDALFLFSLLLFDEIKMQCSSETSFFPVRSLEMKAKVLRTGTRFSVVVMDTCHVPHGSYNARTQPLEKIKFSQAVGTFQLLKYSYNE